MNRVTMGLILALVLVGGGIYGWKQLAVARLQDRVDEERETCVERVGTLLAGQTEELLRLSALPLGWAVRSEMLKENFEQIDAYLQRFVKEDHVERVAVAGADGNLVLATDKKLEGDLAERTYPAEALAANDATVVRRDDGGFLVAVPVVSYDARLGTLLVDYAPDGIEAKVLGVRSNP